MTTGDEARGGALQQQFNQPAHLSEFEFTAAESGHSARYRASAQHIYSKTSVKASAQVQSTLVR